MHVLATELATLEEADVAIDLGQSPAEIVVLSFSDSDLSALAAAWQQDADLLPTMRLASLKRLRHPMSVDLYVETVVARARIVIVRCLGGLDYWRYGFEHIADVARDNGVLFAALPGDDRADPRLAAVSTLAAEPLARLDRFFREGGTENLRQALRYLATLLGRDLSWTAAGAGRPDLGPGRGARRPPGRAGRLLSRQPDGGRHRAGHLSHGSARPAGPGAARRRREQPEGSGDPAATGRADRDPQARDHPEHHGFLRHARRRQHGARRRRRAGPAGGAVGQRARGVARLGPRPLARRPRHERGPARARRPSADPRHLLQGRGADRSAAGIRQRASRARGRSHRLRRAARGGLGSPGSARRRGASVELALVLSDYPARGGRTGYAVGLDTAASARRDPDAAARRGLRYRRAATGRRPTSSACCRAMPSRSRSRCRPIAAG